MLIRQLNLVRQMPKFENLVRSRQSVKIRVAACQPVEVGAAFLRQQQEAEFLCIQCQFKITVWFSSLLVLFCRWCRKGVPKLVAKEIEQTYCGWTVEVTLFCGYIAN